MCYRDVSLVLSFLPEAKSNTNAAIATTLRDTLVFGYIVL